jgi:hypothetical protein
LANPFSLFVTITGDIYVYNLGKSLLDKSTLNAVQSTTVMSIGHCDGLFVDINDNIYCSMGAENKVIKKPSIVVAGTGSDGSSSNMLYSPSGIFVDTSFNLYVADAGNNRIQYFKSGELDATTLAGEKAVGTITLVRPTGIVLDTDKYLFIVDQFNYRIIGSGPNGFRCVAGCSGKSGSASNQLDAPFALSFDSYGNIFVTDRDNHRVQKFILSTNSCSKYLKMFE